MRTPGSAVRAVFRYRRPQPWCWELVVGAVVRDRERGWGAAQAMAQAGPAVAVHADRIAESLDRLLRSYAPTSAHSVKPHVLALAGMGDHRALPGLRLLAEQNRLPSDRPRARVLAALPAAEVLPVILPCLRREPDGHHEAFPLELLAAWGPASAAAVPDVVRYLETPYPYEALRVLGRIGPAAAVAADRLAAYATGRPAQGGRHLPRMAAWAHWRVTGDPALALDVCGSAVGSGSGSHGLPFLADLGPSAAAHADTVRGLMESPGAWARVAAAHAYWRITGDPEPALPVLLAAVDPDWTGRPAMPTQEAVRRLGEIGAPAAAAAPLLRRILASEERLGHPYENVKILADQAYARTLAKALARIGPEVR